MTLLGRLTFWIAAKVKQRNTYFCVVAIALILHGLSSLPITLLETKPLSADSIRLRGVRVNNLKNVNLEIPHGQFLTLCGVSGSGKSSLALDTLYAEGQRRYVESFSPYTRQFLEQLEKPEADSIEGIPPAIAVRSVRRNKQTRVTVGSATEINEYLRLVYSKIAIATCPNCASEVTSDDPQSAASKLVSLNEARFQLVFSTLPAEEGFDPFDFFRRNGFTKAIHEGTTKELSEVSNIRNIQSPTWIVVDRLTNSSPLSRVRDSLETAFEFGQGECAALLSVADSGSDDGRVIEVDGRLWKLMPFARRLVCPTCSTILPDPEPNLFNFNSELGACETCNGTGVISFWDQSKIIPDRSISIEGGAIDAWNTAPHKKELSRFLSSTEHTQLRTDLPIDELSALQFEELWEGNDEAGFAGIKDFFQKLEKRQSKSSLRTAFRKWKSEKTCHGCSGDRLNRMARSFQLQGVDLAELSRLSIQEVISFLDGLELEDWQSQIADRVLGEALRRLKYLEQVGVDYLCLRQTLGSLSNGEAQRVALTSSLGSTLVNVLYVLDEPSSGLHPDDVTKLLTAIRNLHDRGNTLVCVDHHPNFIESADRIIEIGPAAGQKGGEIVFDGEHSSLIASDESLTGQYLCGQKGFLVPETRREARGVMKLVGASGNNLKEIDVAFPLGCLCVVSGVSGSGKSSLVHQTLFPALLRQRSEQSVESLPYQALQGDQPINEVIMIDQSPIGRSPRSNPITYVKAFDEIRKLFAEQMSAKTRNLTAGHFSFNVAKGRCEKCEGDGYRSIDMQFLADVYVKCESCRGTRFRKEILEVKHRGKNISQVLEMPVGQAFGYFRGQPKIQSKLKTLMDVGLDYLPLGQPATTLSSGEAQRLKLAQYLNAKTAKRLLFIMDEPTSGLHMADVANLIETFDALLAVGHSIILIEHNLQVMKNADWIIDLGPGAGQHGGHVVAVGTPESIVENANSRTGVHLKRHMVKA